MDFAIKAIDQNNVLRVQLRIDKSDRDGGEGKRLRILEKGVSLNHSKVYIPVGKDTSDVMYSYM